MIVTPALTFRTINPRDSAHADLAATHHRDACVASFGTARAWEGRDCYLRGLTRRVEEFPDGHVLAYLEDRCVGQLELEVPYGKTQGYASLYCVAREFRGRGFGRLLHAYAVKYFRSWEAETAHLHVSPSNERAVEFYRAMGYRVSRVGAGMWQMTCRIVH